jgi:hypothetical protein
MTEAVTDAGLPVVGDAHRREEYVAERPGQWTANRADLVAELGKIPAVAKMRAGA